MMKKSLSWGDTFYNFNTKLIDTIIYSILRHPHYVTFMILAVIGMLLFQHWIVVIIGIPIIHLIYFDLVNADEDGIKKFGVEYYKYMNRTPRANFLLGLIYIFFR